MCLSCGCKQPNEKHGNDANITLADIEAAAEASEISPREVVKNIDEGMREVARK